jgi:hypothetical protein
MRRATILFPLAGAIVLVVGGAAASLAGHAAAAPAAFGTASVSGPYAFSDTFHDPITTQEGAAVGSIVFNGTGGVTGVYSQNARCSSACGDQLVTRAAFTGTYTVNSDGSATVDICLTLPTSTVRVIWQGAFSLKGSSFDFVQTQLASPCTDPLATQPNVTSGTANKL